MNETLYGIFTEYTAYNEKHEQCCVIKGFDNAWRQFCYIHCHVGYDTKAVILYKMEWAEDGMLHKGELVDSVFDFPRDDNTPWHAKCLDRQFDKKERT